VVTIPRHEVVRTDQVEDKLQTFWGKLAQLAVDDLPGRLELARWAVGNKGARGKGVHVNSLLTYSLDRMDTVGAALDACIKVRVSRAH
jgi:hypothetical protein